MTGQVVQIVDRTGSGFRSEAHQSTNMVLSTLIAHGVLGATALDYHVSAGQVTYRDQGQRGSAATATA